MPRFPVRFAHLSVVVSLFFAVISCQDTASPVDPGPLPEPPAVGTNWSDPSVWPGGTLPAAGQDVTIPAGVRVVLDVSPPELGGVTIDGALEFGRADVELSAKWILVKGALEIGSESNPFAQEALITLTGSPGSEDVHGSGPNGMGTRVLGVVPGGRLDLHGTQRVTWTRLDATVLPGAMIIHVADAIDWAAGDRIVIAPSGFDPYEAEDRAITSVSGRSVTLDAPLNEHHYGQLQTIAGQTLDERAEVGLLSRSIRIQGVGGPDLSGSGGDGFGGHVMVLGGATARVEGVEFYNMGQSGELARYPMHWHMAGEVGGQYFRGNAVWRSNNRCLTIHGTDNLDVRDNVCYDHMGHGYFLEDGAETGNHLEHNLGVLARRPAAGVRLLPSDDRPASFWITNPDNTYLKNSAAGSEGIGFWYALPAQPLGPSAGEPDLPRTTPLGLFSQNVAHSNRRGGLFVDLGPNEHGEVSTTSYRPRSDPADSDSPSVEAVFDQLTAYKNGSRAIWLRGRQHRVTNAVLADNAIAATFASSETFLEDALVAAETANAVSNRQLYRGFEFYDGTVGARRVTFWGFTGNGEIPWSALGYHRTNAFSLSTENAAYDLTFLDSNRVYLEAPAAEKDGDKAAVFFDASGSVTGTSGRYVVANTPFLAESGCDYRSAWNAYSCPGPYIRLYATFDQNVAPARVARDDGAFEDFVGTGNNPSRLSMSLIEGRGYDLGLTATASNIELRLLDALPGHSVQLAVPYASSSFRIVRDYWNADTLVAVGSLPELQVSTGDAYFYDAAAGVLHLKPVVREDRDWAHLRIEPN